MKRLIIVAFSVHSLSLGSDSWFGPDKVKHFFLGAFVQSAAFGTLRATGLQRRPSFVGAFTVTLAAVVGKELRDRGGRGTPSARDAAWGLFGAAAITPLLARAK